MHSRISRSTYRPSEKSKQSMASDLKERQEKLKQFKYGDPVIVSGGMRGIFIAAETQLGNAVVKIGNRKQLVNPLTLA